MFTGREYQPETGLYHYRARFYKPSIGRFLQPDPAGYDDGPNMYTYCGNNPTNFVDPFGMCKGEKGFWSNLWAGKYFGTGYGASSTDRWAERAVASKSWYGTAGNYFMGGLSALWTPETYKETAFTLGTAWFGARASAPKNVSTGKTVLGKYPDYIRLSDKMGARRFNIPTKIWNKMSKAEQWAANQKFLDRTIAHGDDIILSNPVKNVKDIIGAFRKELEYLIEKGYKLSENGTRLIK